MRRKRTLSGQRLILLLMTGACAASLMLLSACAGETTEAEAPGTGSPGTVSPAAVMETAGPTAQTPALTAALSDYSVMWKASSGAAQSLSIGRQDGLYPWAKTFYGELRTEPFTSGDAPGVVYYNVFGDGFRLWYGHAADTDTDYVSRFQTTSPAFRTPDGIGVDSTTAELFDAYGANLLYQPEPFPVSQDYGGDFCAYDFLLVYTKDGDTCVVFFVQETAESNIVRGLALLSPHDGSPWFTADNEMTFAVGDTLRQALAQPDTSAEQAIHSLLQDNETAAVDRKKILSKLPDLNWAIYAKLYGTQAPDLLTWLFSQTFTEDNDILSVLGATDGLDAAYAEGYASIIAGIYDKEPEKLIRQLAKLQNGKLDKVAGLLAYGLSYFDAEPIKAELQAITENSRLTEREQTAARVVLAAVGDFEARH